MTDAATIADALALFLAPDDVVEIRAFDVKRPGRVVAGFVRADRVRAQSGMIAHIADHAAGGCYFTPQQLAPAVFDRTKNMIVETKKRKGETFPRLTHDEDVTARRFLLVDVDPVRADGFKDDSTTDDEKEAGWEVAEAVREYLAGRDWSEPLVVDSGNGYHLYYRLPEPVCGGSTDGATDPIALTLKCLSSLIGSTRAKVDTAVFNSSRIMKVPGTWARKGAHTSTRPHRLSRVLNVPEGWEVT
jgi:hypothetical protein